MAEGELLKSCGALREKNQVERAVRPAGKRHFNRNHAELGKRFERGAVHVSGGTLLHPGGEIADAQALDACAGVEVQMTRDAGDVAGVRSGDGLENEQRIFDGASHGAELIERPAKGHRAGAGHAAEGGAQPGDSATHAGADDAAAGLAADGEADQPRRRGGARASAGARRAFFQEPRVHGLSAKPNVVEGERAETELREEHGACGVKALHDGGVFFRNAIAERLGAVSSGDSGGVQKILAAPRDAVKRTAVFAGGDFFVGLLCLGEREIARERDDAAQLGIELLDALQIDLGEALGS